ncbi:MAG: hypothetical protein QMD50_01330 [Patescibacteria group bacterium]|nr:hypothetical protein [Patescibacteria group bacterium]
MTIFVFGNPDIKEDSLPIKILPELKKIFPDIEFKIKDPNEEWNLPEELIIIDTAVGINNMKIFNSLNEFAKTPRVSVHDFDALTQLRILQKLGKLKKIKIIGVPPMISEEKAIEEISTILRSNKL